MLFCRLLNLLNLNWACSLLFSRQFGISFESAALAPHWGSIALPLQCEGRCKLHSAAAAKFRNGIEMGGRREATYLRGAGKTEFGICTQTALKVTIWGLQCFPDVRSTVLSDKNWPYKRDDLLPLLITANPLCSTKNWPQKTLHPWPYQRDSL